MSLAPRPYGLRSDEPGDTPWAETWTGNTEGDTRRRGNTESVRTRDGVTVLVLARAKRLPASSVTAQSNRVGDVAPSEAGDDAGGCGPAVDCTFVAVATEDAGNLLHQRAVIITLEDVQAWVTRAIEADGSRVLRRRTAERIVKEGLARAWPK